MRAPADFNYKVALAAGLRSLDAGRLRAAEEQFRYLVAKFPSAEGGYRGLAKVLAGLDDRDGALAVLLQGAAALANEGQRDGAITLLREAIRLQPFDVSAHRRLAAALSLAGSADRAADEYVRFANAEAAAGRLDRARMDVAYALERHGPLPGLVTLAASLGVEAPPAIASSAEVRDHVTVEDGQQAVADAEPDAVAERADRADGDGAADDRGVAHGAQTAGARVADGAGGAGATGVADAAGSAERGSLAAETADAASADDAARAGTGAPVDAGSGVDAALAEERAAELITRRDPAAADAVLAAAQAHLAQGRAHAAADLLIQLIASGLGGHEPQRLLIEASRALGSREAARARCALLAYVLRLDGKDEAANDVARLAEAM